MELGLKGKVAAITGGTQGIGRASARQFAREGAKVAICSRRADKVQETTQELEKLGADAMGVAADVSTPEGVQQFVDAVIKRFGRLDILVNNAGTSMASPFEKVTDATWQEDFDLKVFGAIRGARCAIPQMKKQGSGRIINITTVGGKQPGANSVPTTISRAAGLALTKALSKELAPHNILVNTVCIGKIKSGQHERRIEREGIRPEEYYARVGKTVPMQRMGEAEEVANVIAFLASDAASYVTGTSVNLDGGPASAL